MKSILVVEHDGALQNILQRLFSAEGFEVDVVSDGTAGLEMLRQRSPIATILNVASSGNSECDLCKKIARSIPNAPLIILSASSDAADKVLFLIATVRSSDLTLRNRLLGSNVYRTETFCSTCPKPHLHTPSLVSLVRRQQPPPESTAWHVAQRLSALPVFVEGQVRYLFQGRQLGITASMIGHLGTVDLCPG